MDANGIYDVRMSDGTPAQLWSDDTFTLHFGAGFDEQSESTPDVLAEAVSVESLLDLAGARIGDGRNDAAKAIAALRICRDANTVRFDFDFPAAASVYCLDEIPA